MNLVEAFVFFVGLAVVTDQVPNDAGVKVIMPTVRHHTGFTLPWRRTAAHVEDHMAVLIFPTDSYVKRQSSWKIAGTLKEHPEFSYVKLDGDSVRFLTGEAANPASALSDNVVLPRLKREICPNLQGLRSDYEWPYAGGSAVFSVSQGTMESCVSKTGINTKLVLSTDGTLTVSASTMRRRKDFVLKPAASGKIELVAANLPTRYILQGNYADESPDRHARMVHSSVYASMVTAREGEAMCHLSLYEWFLAHGEFIQPQCNLSIPGLGSQQPKPMTSAALIDGAVANFECSNTQYP